MDDKKFTVEDVSLTMDVPKHLVRGYVRRLIEPTPCAAKAAKCLLILLDREFRRTARSCRRWKHRAGVSGGRKRRGVKRGK